ncbi:MAG: hypothetical protein K9H49_09875 [Bacteroidales bacterium]|nr:hypothetical protein [Bacteroidales bacterium]MCF8389659.1 hypothetical protein [Bacteroidales bacterium]
MRLFVIPVVLFFLMESTYSQSDSSKWEFSGYLSNMQSVMVLDEEQNWISDNLFHNRMNLSWFPYENFTGVLQFRNRFMYGQSIQLFDGYAESIDREQSLLDLSVNILEGNSYFINTAIDRAYFQYNLKDFVFTLGRQRINWGQTFVWNPNDIFNVQNFFDFDYPEKPGSDAVRIQYYTNYSSSLELAAKLDHEKKLTMAGYYRFNTLGYDFQVLAGLLAEEDYLAGLGWSGDIFGAGFRGEMSYFQPKRNFSDTSGVFYSSISLDYTFHNSLYIQTEGLYSLLPENFNLSGFMEYYQGPLTVKNLSFSKWSWFAQLSYPITPLLNLSFAGMYFPDLNGFYIGPTLSYSLKDNMELSIISQVFHGDFTQSNTSTDMYFCFLRYKFSF